MAKPPEKSKPNAVIAISWIFTPLLETVSVTIVASLVGLISAMLRRRWTLSRGLRLIVVRILRARTLCLRGATRMGMRERVQIFVDGELDGGVNLVGLNAGNICQKILEIRK